MLWLPYTQMKTAPRPLFVEDAEGVYLYSQGKPLIDSISCWWRMIHGHRHPEMTEAIVAQARRFSDVMLGGIVHEPAARLAAKLEAILPGDLNHVFFSDSGSVGVEVALKMALQYYVNRGDYGRANVLALERAYHGDTFKAMEVGDDEDYHFILKASGTSGRVVHIPTTIEALERAFAAQGERFNALIVEPLLQGAGGMLVYDVSFLRRARELCDAYDVLLIFDEVATGFGRTGNRFVSDLVLPDIVVLGKALTGGCVGHAATVANDKTFYGFYDDRPECALMHGPTFMGNALACAAALKSIELFERDDYMSKIKAIEETTRREVADFEDPRVREVRGLGACVCFEARDRNDLRGFAEFARERGVFARPFLNCQYAMVPYVIQEEELARVLQTMKDYWRTLR